MILPPLIPTLPILTPIYNSLTPSDVILLLFGSIVQFYSGGVFYKGFLKSLRNGALGMDALVVVGTSSSYCYGVTSIITSTFITTPSGGGSGGSEFLETSAVLITFVLMGKYLQAKATTSTSKALQKLGNLTPARATLVRRKGRKEGGKVEDINECFERDEDFLNALTNHDVIEDTVDLALVQVGDIVKLTRGGSVPCDGRVIKCFGEGGIAVNEGMITGEVRLRGREGGGRGGGEDKDRNMRVLLT
jgi:P-type Cu+ transporter